MLYPPEISFKIEGKIKTSHDKQKLKQYMTTRPAFQKILKEILHMEDENNIAVKRWRLLNLKTRAEK
jgi:hypothetical protein